MGPAAAATPRFLNVGSVVHPSGAAASLFDRPIFIVSTPRSGSTLLFQTLVQAPGLYSIGDEGHALFESIPELTPWAHGWSSNRLTAEDAAPGPVTQLANSFYLGLRDRDGAPPQGRVRTLEKTPKNALRVPFLDAAFRDAYFIYLYRDVRQTLSSMIEAWESGRFRTYPRLPGWQGHAWSLLLVPGWEKLKGLPLAQIIGHQWAITTEQLLDDLAAIPAERVTGLNYTNLLAAPQPAISGLAAAVGLGWDLQLGRELPLSRTTISRPEPDKWRRHQAEIEAVWPIVERADTRAREFLASMSAGATAPL